MYNERKDKLSWLNFLVYGVILLIIVIVIIIVVVKSNAKKEKVKPVEKVLYSIEQLDKLEKDFGADMAANMANFKYTVIDYYKNKLGSEKVNYELTLQDLYDKHLIQKLAVGSVECNSSQSKINITKKSGEYEIKFVLVCDKEAQMITYLGKYDHCKDSSVCEKKIEKNKQGDEKKENIAENVEPNKNNENKENETNNKKPLEENKEQNIEKYIYYEYNLKPNDEIGSYSEWSSWDKTKKDESLTVLVEKKTEVETKTSDCKETKEETYISGYKTETYVSGYTTKKYKVGTKKVQTGTKQVVVNGKVITQPIYAEQPIYQTKQEPVYATKKTPVYSKRTVTVDNCKVNVDYYRYRTFTYKKGVNYVIYSTNDNDTNLLNRGYVKTGKTIEK